MQEKLLFTILGGLIISLLINVLTITLLYKKQSVTNEIDNLKQKNKHNKNSTIDNDIKADIQSKDTKEKRPRRRKLFNKKD